MSLGKPNDRTFLNTSEVSQIGFSMLQKSVWLIWSCPENVLSVRMSLGNFGRLQSLGGFFVSSETVSHPKGSPVESSRTRRSRASIKRFLGRVCLYFLNFSGDFFLTIITISDLGDKM